jgi:hypothetical protein
MEYKPGDFFLGVVDFLAILVPGAVLSFALTPYAEPIFGVDHLFPSIPDTPARWIAFLIIAYVIGHLIASVASSLLDPLYDRTYRNLHRLPKKEPRICFLAKIKAAWKLEDDNASDPLLAVAKELRDKQIKGLGLRSGSASLAKKSTLMWAQSQVTLLSSTAAAEIERYQANSKFFRSMTVVLSVLIGVTIYRETLSWLLWYHVSLIFLLLILFCYRFMQLRWEATKRTYEYFLLLELNKEQFSEKKSDSHKI